MKWRTILWIGPWAWEEKHHYKQWFSPLFYFCVFASLLCSSEGIRVIQMRREGSCGWKREKKSCRGREKRHFNTFMFCPKDHVFIWCSQKQLYSISIYQSILSIKDCVSPAVRRRALHFNRKSSKYDFVCTTAAREEVIQSSAHRTWFEC